MTVVDPDPRVLELERGIAERTQWLELIHGISRAIAEAPSWDEALRAIVRRVCDVGRWQIGHLYLRHPRQTETQGFQRPGAVCVHLGGETLKQCNMEFP